MQTDNLSARDLSQRFNDPVDTIKRWNREFLPPDPTSGRQAGRARMFTPDESLTLYFAGYLIRIEGYGINETGQILSDLKPWLLEKKLMPSSIGLKRLPQYELFIQKRTGEDFFRYDTKMILARDRLMEKGGKVTMQESYVLASIPGQKRLNGIEYTKIVRVSIIISLGLSAIGWKRQG